MAEFCTVQKSDFLVIFWQYREILFSWFTFFSFWFFWRNFSASCFRLGNFWQYRYFFAFARMQKRWFFSNLATYCLRRVFREFRWFRKIFGRAILFMWACLLGSYCVAHFWACVMGGKFGCFFREMFLHHWDMVSCYYLNIVYLRGVVSRYYLDTERFFFSHGDSHIGAR